MTLRRLLRRLGAVLVVLLLAAGAFVVASCGTIRAGLLLDDATGPPDALRDEVAESEAFVGRGAERLRLRLVRPRGEGGPLPAFLLCHGAVEDGADDPRLVGFARALAVRGASVASLELSSLAAFQLDGEDPQRIARAVAWLAAESGLADEDRVALVGISVGGSYALVAAADPEVRDRVSAVLAFGAYADLEALLLRWMTSARPGAPDGLFDPLREGRRRVLLGNAARLVPPEDLPAAEAALRALVEGRPAPPAPGVGPRTRAVLAAAASEEPLSEPAARMLLEGLREDLRRLSPAAAPGVPSAPVYLLHAEADPIVSAADSRVLLGLLEERGAAARLHLTDLFGHVDPSGASPGLLEAWPLLSFVADFLADSGL